MFTKYWLRPTLCDVEKKMNETRRSLPSRSFEEKNRRETDIINVCKAGQ